MAVPYDTSDPKFAEYAHPGRLVSTQWLAEHLGTPGLVVVESDEDVLLYETGHIEGAVKVADAYLKKGLETVAASVKVA